MERRRVDCRSCAEAAGGRACLLGCYLRGKVVLTSVVISCNTPGTHTKPKAKPTNISWHRTLRRHIYAPLRCVICLRGPDANHDSRERKSRVSQRRGLSLRRETYRRTDTSATRTSTSHRTRAETCPHTLLKTRPCTVDTRFTHILWTATDEIQHEFLSRHHNADAVNH